MARIILLEPDYLIATDASLYLSRAGHDVEIHSDPQEAILGTDKHKPDLVVLDLQLAGRSGLEFLYELRSYPEWQSIPAIVLTNLHSEELRAFSEQFSELKVLECLYKPSTSLASLNQKIQNILQPASV